MYRSYARMFERHLNRERRKARREDDAEKIEQIDFLLETPEAFHVACEQCTVDAGVVEDDLEIDFFGELGDGAIVEQLIKLMNWFIENWDSIAAIIAKLMMLFASPGFVEALEEDDA